MRANIRSMAGVLSNRRHDRRSLATLSLPDDNDEVTAVMLEITEALDAIGALLAMEGDPGAEMEILHAVTDTLFNHKIVEDLIRDGTLRSVEGEYDKHRWQRVTVEAREFDIFIIPVQRVAGHRQMIIYALCDRLDQARRADVESIYLKRRPFAIGYFRLWQLDRARLRREQAFEATLNTLQTGIILIDRTERIVFVNNAAQEIIGRDDALMVVGDTVRASNLHDTVRLRVALENIASPSAAGTKENGGFMLAIDRPAERPLTLIILPLAHDDNEASAIAGVMYVIDPKDSLLDLLQPWCDLQGLSRSEKQLACSLARGLTLSAAAVELKMKEQTARSLLKHIFIKTNTKRQSDLIYLMLMSVVKLGNFANLQTL